ncbi:MAG TPA: geranylgeranylglycerol-phosphate geranylgeranyltransferase [Cyclobacteriaceae bacterium]|nr:geranylgeranylglycerol-phosphate geranylgeranyltransferase [Cyclobacteriaceae bacterium]
MNTRLLLRKAILLLKLVRWPNLIIILVTQYFTAVFLSAPDEPWMKIISDPYLFLVVLGTVLTAAAGYIINDYYDIKIDYLNKPDRVIVGKEFDRRIALAAHVIITFIAILIGFLADWRIGLTNMAAAFLLWLYSNLLKRLPFLGNFCIASLTALSIIIITIYYQRLSWLVIGYGLFGFLITLVREVLKDIEDLKGDQTFGCKTIPILWGIRKTKYFVLILVVVFIGSFLSIILQFKILMLYFYIVVLAIPFITFIWKLFIADTRKEFSELSRLAKILMVLGIGSMVFFKF